MITDEQVQRIALFFLFSLMDEKVALLAAHKSVAQLKAMGSNASSGSSSATEAQATVGSADLIRVLRKQYEHYNKQLPRNRVGAPPSEAWTLPPDVDFSLWIRFQKEATEQEVMAVTLAKVLGFEEEAIAAGLNISLGTARYRIGKGIRQLGLTARAKG